VAIASVEQQILARCRHGLSALAAINRPPRSARLRTHWKGAANGIP